MKLLIKVTCILLYSLAIFAPYLGLSIDAIYWLQLIAAILLAAHILETIIFFRFVKLYSGSLIDSIALNLTFGLAHWLPLAKK